jgi:hypothetical protein
MTDVAAPAQIGTFALSPDGTRLAVAVAGPASGGKAATQQIRVYDLATSAERGWSLSGAAAARGVMGGMSWAADDRTLAFNWYGAATAGVRILDTSGPGGNLIADSGLVLSTQSHGGQPACNGDGMMTPDGSVIVCPAAPGPISRAPLRRSQLPKTMDRVPAFVQGYAEFSVATGQLVRMLGEYRYGHTSETDSGSGLLMWTSRSGGVLVVQDFYPSPIVDIVSRGQVTRIPWSDRISAGQGSTSQAAW